jgi:CubicO group peptidase (beta-lactamase class C family)
MDVAGILVERVSGMKLHEYFHQHILKPIGVEDLGFWLNQTMLDSLSKMHLRQPNGEIIEVPHTITAANSPLGYKGSCNGGGGCLGSLQEYSSKLSSRTGLSTPPMLILKPTEILATLLNGGTSPTTGAQILQPESVKVMLENALQDHPNLGRQKFDGFPFAANGSDDLYPQTGNPPQGWSIAGFILLEPDASTGKLPGTVWWAGLANLYWWLDVEGGVAGIIGSQVLPFLGE